MKTTRRKISAVAISTSIIVLAGSFSEPVSAQGARTLEEVVVTAQRREQSLQDVPVSIETFSGEQIEAQGFRDLGQMSAFVPSLRVDDQQQNSQGLAIRGVGTSSNNLALEQSVPIFIDGIHYGRGSNIFNAFMDVDRVEILRGPQPVYFGQNASAGAISVVTRKPTPSWEGSASAEVGNNAILTSEIGAGGPITDTLGIRLAGKYDASEGFMTDIARLRKYPEREAYSGRVTVQWQPTSALEVTGKVDYTNVERAGDGRTPAACVARSDRTIGSALTGEFDAIDVVSLAEKYDLCGLNEYGFENSGPWFKLPLTVFEGIGAPAQLGMADLSQIANELPVGPFSTLKQTASYIEVAYVFANEISLTSQTAFSKLDREFARDGQGVGPFLVTGNNRWELQDQWSQEFRLSSPASGFLEWMAGIYWQDMTLSTGSNSYRANIDGLTVPRSNIQGNRHVEDDRWLSAFAALTFNVTDELSVDLGARYTYIQKDGIVRGVRAWWLDENGDIIIGEEGHGVTAVAHTPIDFTGSVTAEEYSEDNIDPQVVLRWRPTDSLSTYAKYATGMKAGGFDASVTRVVSSEAYVFNSEYAENWELGLRGSLLDGSMDYGVTLFWTDFEGMQVSATNQDTGLSSTTNVASQRVKGVEFDGRWAVSDQFGIGFSGSLMDSLIVSYPGANCTEDEVFRWEAGDLEACPGRNQTPARSLTDRSGEVPPDVPDWAVNVRADYWMPVLDAYKLTAATNVMFSDGYKMGFSGIFQMERHWDMNLSVGIGDQGDKWHLSAWARNINEPKQKYFPEFNHGDETLSTFFSSKNFMTFGLQYKYNFL